MEKHEKDHITKNFDKLINCTKDENIWFIHLLKCGLVSHPKWQAIKGQQHDTVSIISELYLECMKSPKYAELVESLRNCDNDIAANILQEINSLPTPTKPSTAAASSLPPAPAEESSSADDFTITENHLVGIKKVLENVEDLEGEWDEVLLSLKLSGKSKGEINKLKLKNINFGTLILKTLGIWRGEKAKQATFNKLVAAIESCSALGAEQLEEKRKTIQNS